MIQILLMTIFGRLLGSDYGKPYTSKPYMCALSGLVFAPDWMLCLMVFLGLWFGHTLRDSIFDLLTGWSTKRALFMTLKAFSFMPIMAWCYIYGYGLSLHPMMLVCFAPMLLRAPVQYACGFIPLPVEAPKKGFKSLYLGRAEIYEIAWCFFIATSVYILVK